MILYKTTNRLFKGQYQYKIVLTVPGSSLFRSGDMDATLRQLQKIDLNKTSDLLFYRANIKSKDDLDYTFKLQSTIKKLESKLWLRVESPWVSVYTNEKSVVKSLTKLDESRVKYVCAPPEGGTLVSGTVILPKINFEYKVTLGKTNHENSAFIEWAEQNSKVKLTKSCINHLTKDSSWGGSYFYITGDKNLLVAKMHLGGSIGKIERVVKA